MQPFLPGVASGVSSTINFDRVRSWMFDKALPLWAERGVDRAHGGFLEELTFDAEPTACAFNRVRVICRQIYVFSHAATLGWTAGAEVAAVGYRYLLEHARLPDGGWARRLSREGRIIDATPDLYDIAFVIFALGWYYRVSKDEQARALGIETLNYVQERMKAPHGGFWHALPPDGPRVQNPHMHLVEACHVAFESFGDQRFLDQANDVVTLFRGKFFDGETLGEFFDIDWTRDESGSGAVLEPGHQFEWAWILATHQRFTGVDLGSEIGALAAFAERFGVDAQSQVAFDGVLRTGEIIVGSARSWPSTERIKAWVALARQPELQPIERINGSIDLLFDRYFRGCLPGLWVDRFDAAGKPMVSVVPASVLYHIFLAFAEVLRLEQQIGSRKRVSSQES